MTDKLRDLTAEDREWIDARADQLYRDSERQRGGIRPATIMPQDFRDYFVAQAAWERARAALAAAPQTAPAPAADERDEIERIICDAFTCDLRGRGDEDGAFWQTAADALLAAGWARGGNEAGLREAAEGDMPARIWAWKEDHGDVWTGEWTPERDANHVPDHAAEYALARPSAPETLAWAVVGEDGSLIGINYDRETAQHLCNPGESVVRVAIRVVEDEA